ncbi:MAG: toxin-antitoxin system HicB family antitoxin [Chloroflexi bacterium]|nr:toxin-antitoxin system HicB family antitoxin [Chloroflexota bacterium]
MGLETKSRRVMLSSVPPELWARCKAEAALAGKTLNEWVIETLVEKLEDSMDAREGTQAMIEPGESIPWEAVKAELEARMRTGGV